MYRGQAQYPAFAPGSSEVTVGFFGLFVSLGPESAPTAHAHGYFWSPTISFYFIAGGEVCPGADSAVKDPRS